MMDDDIGRIVVDAAIAVHREMGPGLLEAVYETVLAHELRERNLDVSRQVPVPLYTAECASRRGSGSTCMSSPV